MNAKQMVVCLIVGAACALSASTASADEFHLPSLTSEPTNTHVFKTNAGEVTCSTIDFSTTASGTTTQVTLNPKYEGCTAFGFTNVPIDVNGCGYLATADGLTHVECPAGKETEITAPGCTVKIGAQTVNKVTFASNEAKTDITSARISRASPTTNAEPSAPTAPISVGPH